MKKTNLSKKITYTVVCGMAAFGCLAAAVFMNTFPTKADSTLTLSIDTLDYNTRELPKGYEGMSYPVFKCVALDETGNRVTDVEGIVYDSNGEILTVKDGRFQTETAGDYKIEYTVNKLGYPAVTETLCIEVLEADNYTQLTYAPNEEVVSATTTGTPIFLPNATVQGGGEIVSVGISVIYEGEYSTETTLSEVDGLKYFIPEAEGEYIVSYSSSDFVGGISQAKYNIVVTDSMYPILNTPSVMSVAHVGKEIVFPVAEAILYKDGEKIYVPVAVDVNEEDITSTMCYKPEQAGQYTVQYSAVNVYDKSFKTEYSTVFTAYGEESVFYAARYFGLDGFEIGYREESEDRESYVTTFTSTAEAEKASFSFKNALPVECLSVSLGVETRAYNFRTLNIYFTDSKYAEQRVCLSLQENEHGYIDVLLNGKSVNELNKSFSEISNDYEKSSISISYDPAKKAILGQDGGVIAYISSGMDGLPFNGFLSGAAYVSVEIKELTGQSQLKLYTIASQTISNALSDTLAPIFTYNSNFFKTKYADKGQTVLIGGVSAFDIFDGEVPVKVSVKTLKGKTVYSGLLDNKYELLLEEYGSYTIEYFAVDSAGKKFNTFATIFVVDRIAPKLSLNAVLAEVSVGKEQLLPEMTATDNFTEKCTTWISVMYGNNQKDIVVDGKYTFEETGEYVIQYGAMDADGNYTIIEYTVVCK